MSKQTILITGATGHLGFRTLVLALQAGYKARIAVRKLEQAERVQQTTSIQPFLQDVNFVEVPDITADGAYNKAIKDVDLKDWQATFYDPAKSGTLSMLSAAAKSTNVRRVVITSSVVALKMNENKTRPDAYSIAPLPDLKTADKASYREAYAISKVLAHHAATDFVKEHKVSFDLIRILPGYIQGANELLTDKEDIQFSSNVGTIHAALGILSEIPRMTAQVFLDDVAKAHVLALDPKVATDGDNFLIAGNGGVGIPWDEFGKATRRIFPGAVEKGVFKPVAGQQSITFTFDVEASEKALGFEFAGVDSMVQSVAGQYLELGGFEG